MTDTLTVLHAVDRLYASVVTDPESWHVQAFADWAEDAAATGVTKVQVRAIRRCMRMAERLRDFWAADVAAVGADDWRTRVDVAHGSRAWRPTLELAQAGLESEPSEELFEEVKERFRLVNSEHWMDGVGYEQWLATDSE